MRQSGVMNTCKGRTRVFRARFASDASPCRKRSVATYSPTAPQRLGEEMAHGHTGGWLLAAETISAGQTTRPPEIIIDITSEEIRGHTSLSIAVVIFD